MQIFGQYQDSDLQDLQLGIHQLHLSNCRKRVSLSKLSCEMKCIHLDLLLWQTAMIC